MLNIARQIQIGYNLQRKTELPEAEVIPIGESTNEKKKLAKITSEYQVLKEYENIPLPGFTLFRTDKKNWGSTDSTWLVIDPRGFLVRISNLNLESILHVTGITEGLIQERCVWARNNTQTKMILIPISSSNYIQAVNNTELIESKVDIKDVQIGDKVILQNELQGCYMGTVSLYGPLNVYSIDNEYRPKTFLRRQVIEVEPGKYHYQTNLKILKVLEKSLRQWSREETVAHMNKEISAGAYFTSLDIMQNSGSASIRDQITFVSVDAVRNITMSYEDIAEHEAIDIFQNSRSICDPGMLVLEKDDKKYLIDYPYFVSSALSISITSFAISEIKDLCLDKIILKDQKRYTSSSSKYYSLDMFTKFYKIVKHVKTNTYI